MSYAGLFSNFPAFHIFDGLPEYLQHDLDAYKEGLKNKSDLLDCLWGELYGSINIAEINDGAITREHAEFLRNKYLFGGKHDRND